MLFTLRIVKLLGKESFITCLKRDALGYKIVAQFMFLISTEIFDHVFSCFEDIKCNISVRTSGRSEISV